MKKSSAQLETEIAHAQAENGVQLNVEIAHAQEEIGKRIAENRPGPCWAKPGATRGYMFAVFRGLDIPNKVDITSEKWNLVIWNVDEGPTEIEVTNTSIYLDPRFTAVIYGSGKRGTLTKYSA